MPQHRVDPIRQQSPLIGHKRRALENEFRVIETHLDELDAELSRLAARREELNARRRVIHRQLWVNLAKRGRRALPDGRHALPPLPVDPVRLWGRRLRAVCRVLLGRRGPLALVELHAELHRNGYAIDHAHPVKALADALGYETRQGRTRRLARGTYQLAVGGPLRLAG